MVDFTTFQILGQKLSNFFVGILVETMTPKGHFEINWPLEPRDSSLTPCHLQGVLFWFFLAWSEIEPDRTAPPGCKKNNNSKNFVPLQEKKLYLTRYLGGLPTQIGIYNQSHVVMFVYSEKATEFWEIFTLLLSTVYTDKSKVKILQILWPSQNIRTLWLKTREVEK